MHDASNIAISSRDFSGNLT